MTLPQARSHTSEESKSHHEAVLAHFSSKRDNVCGIDLSTEAGAAPHMWEATIDMKRATAAKASQATMIQTILLT